MKLNIAPSRFRAPARLVAMIVALIGAGWVAVTGAASAQPAAETAAEAAQPGLVTGAPAARVADPDVVMTLRGGVQVGPAYFGSDEYEVGPDIGFRFDYLRLPGGFEFGSNRTVGFVSGFGLRGSVRYIGERDSSDYDEIDGLDDVDASLEAGLGLGYEQRNYRAFVDLRYGVIGHNAFAGEIGADAIAYPLEGLTVTAGPRLHFGDSRFADTYFGVSPDEAAASGLAAYDADAGLLGAGVELGARYLINDNWGVEGVATWDRLTDTAADSPITVQGSEDQYSVRIGLTRRISLDF